MTTPKMQNAGVAACAPVNQAGGPNPQLPINEQSTTDTSILASKSTTTAVQEAKVMSLLRQGPKTTMELREHGVMMPAARVHTLKHQRGHTITTELLPLFDRQGIRHSKCARYHLVQETAAEVSA